MTIVYKFKPCSYEKLQKFIELDMLEMSAWKLITPEYINGLEFVESADDKIIALIYYEQDRNGHCEMFIMEFEVIKDFRRQSHGYKIIRQFLTNHQKSVELLPLGEESVAFWQSCGFVGDSYGLFYYPDN